jgi:putative DNA-invertase from lambdoid prophage Rac
MTIYSYLRVSTNKQDVSMQREVIASRGIIIEEGKEYVDFAISGATNGLDRPAYAALIDVLERGDTIYTYSLDRIGRDTKDVITSIETLDSMGVTLVMLKEGIITEGSMGRFIITILAAINQLNREGIVQRVRDGMNKESTKKKLLERPSSLNKQEVIETIKGIHETYGKLSINNTMEALLDLGIIKGRSTVAEYINTIYNT